jgi:hypothetical protein
MAVVDEPFTARVAANGIATVRFKTSNTRQKYTVQQVTTEYPTSPLGCVCNIRKNGNLISPMIPTGDAASGDPPIVLSQNDIMTVVFSSATPGDTVSVFVIYDDGTPE